VPPGDLVVGDADGVIVVPRDIESVVLDNALAKVAGEDRTRDALLRGAKLRDVFAEYNVL
jgi:regulator of RNase E activity RraA